MTPIPRGRCRVGAARVLAMCLLLSAACSNDQGKSKKDSCAKGDAGCVCQTAADCGQGATCEAHRCNAYESRDLVVAPAEARACEVLLVERAARVRGFTIADSVRGTFVREAPRTALSFISREDQPFKARALQVRLDKELEGPTVEVVHCADASGTPIPKATVTLSD